MTMYFGPVRNVPSWQWVGFDVAKFLGTHHDIRFFDDVSELPMEALVFWIKCPLEGSASIQIVLKRLRVVFFPVDVFRDVEHIAACRSFIDSCSLVVLHSRNLAKYFDKNKIRHIDHYNKYGIMPAERRPGDTLLWIGGFQYFPYVVRFVLEHQPRRMRRAVFLTDYRSPNAIAAANNLGRTLGLGIGFSDMANFADLNVVEWSVPAQKTLLQTCAGAFDCKGTEDFNQLHKPPTKLQKYLCSGIPCAINADSTLQSNLGFELCDLLDDATWFSPDYKALTEEYSRMLNARLSLAAIAAQYLQFAREAQVGAGGESRWWDGAATRIELVEEN